MIHYGAQYVRLTEIVGKELVGAKLVLSEASSDAAKALEAYEHACEKREIATQAYNTTFKKFRDLVSGDVYEAVDRYKEEYGSYPI